MCLQRPPPLLLTRGRPTPLMSPRCVNLSRRRPPHPYPALTSSVLPPFPAFPLPLWAPSLVSVAHRRRCSRPPPSHLAFFDCGALPVWGGALFIRLSYHACLWDVLCVTPVLHTGCGVMLQGLICSHGCVQSSCCAVVVTFSWPRTSVGCCACALCVHREGVPADVWCVR